MDGREHYYTLISSLPAMPRHFAVEQVPITQTRLEKRLDMLSDQDREAVEQLRAFLLWDRQPWDKTDEEVVAHYNELTASLKNSTAKQIASRQLDIRIVLSGLRRRRKGMSPPIMAGRWGRHIKDNWQEAEFKLHWKYPWIADVDRLIDDYDCKEVARILLEASWKYLGSLADQVTFSFDAVLIYLARWEIIYRWTSLDAEKGRERFQQLVTESLDEYANQYE